MTLLACGADGADERSIQGRALEETAPSGITPASSADEVTAYNAHAESQAGLLYTLDVGDKHSLKFFDNPAGPFIMETAPIGAELVLGTAAPSVLFTKRHPGEQVPPELAAFDDLAAPDSEARTHDKHATSSFTHFRDHHRFCPTVLLTPPAPNSLAFPAFATGCWPNAGGLGSTANLATHSQAFAGSFNGTTIATVRNNGVWVTTMGIVQGEVRSFVLGNPADRRDGRRYWRVQEHRYEFDGASFSRHVGVAYVNDPLAPSQFLQAFIVP
jgi:hypothetical protein